MSHRQQFRSRLKSPSTATRSRGRLDAKSREHAGGALRKTHVSYAAGRREGWSGHRAEAHRKRHRCAGRFCSSRSVGVILARYNSLDNPPAGKAVSFSAVRLHTDDGQILVDNDYPFEFTAPLDPDAQSFEFSLSVTTVDGQETRSQSMTLSRSAAGGK